MKQYNLTLTEIELLRLRTTLIIAIDSYYTSLESATLTDYQKQGIEANLNKLSGILEKVEALIK